MNETFKFQSIGIIQSPYKTKFGVPRQPGLTNRVISSIHLEKNNNNLEAIRGLEDFSHIWVIFVFHSLKRKQWKPLVSPPRFQNSRKLGVLATRSPYRPNPIGQSVVKLEKIEILTDKISIEISGGDFLNQTPVLDIKPYISYADIVEDANSAWATSVEPSLEVQISQRANSFLHEQKLEHLKPPIQETLSFDPRPGYERGSKKVDGDKYFIQFDQMDIQWSVKENICLVEDIKFFKGKRGSNIDPQD